MGPYTWDKDYGSGIERNLQEVSSRHFLFFEVRGIFSFSFLLLD